MGTASPSVINFNSSVPTSVQNPTKLRSDLHAKLLSQLREEQQRAGEDSKNVKVDVREVQGQQSSYMIVDELESSHWRVATITTESS